jgi:hypothetical protein
MLLSRVLLVLKCQKMNYLVSELVHYYFSTTLSILMYNNSFVRNAFRTDLV